MKIDQKLLFDKIPQVLKYKKTLDDLGQNWNTLNLLNQVNDSGESMEKTQQEFTELSDELLLHLSQESLKQLSNEITSKSQVVIDILIRNLFERTADIGFLATDDVIRKFIKNATFIGNKLLSFQQFNESNESCQKCPEPFQIQCKNQVDSPILNSIKEILCASNETDKKNSLQKGLSVQNIQIKELFYEYTHKYSVYDNVFLTDPQGNILISLDDSFTLKKSNDTIIKDSLLTKEEFVEYFGKSDFSKNGNDVLLYGYKIFETNEKIGEPIGVLILRFKFEDEMSGIYSFLHNGIQNSVMGILNRSNEFISSSNTHIFPIGTKIKQINENSVDLIEIGGKKYLIKISTTRGYQGFFGLGWKGCCLVSLDEGFIDDTSSVLSSIDHKILDAVMSSPSLFSKELQEIPMKAKKIQADLSRTVWNGSLKQQTLIAKKLLSQVAATGQNTNAVFNNSIESLHETVLKTMLNVVTFQASLGIDIMDRNLYERANDCRWWALGEQFKKILANEKITLENIITLEEILKYINDLYTVYINLFIYDKNGKIIAVSNDQYKEFKGVQLDDVVVKNTLANKDSQKYFVSKFEPTTLYDNQPTYVYHASITNMKGDQNIGGIGIVFDAKPQFQSILEDILPTTDSSKQFALFIDKSKTVISSSNPNIKVNTPINLPDQFINLAKGEHYSSIIEYQDCFYAVGSQSSKGYREYKNNDGYTNEVFAISFSLLNCKQDIKETITHETHFTIAPYPKTNEPIKEFGTFFMGHYWYGFETKNLDSVVGFEELQKDNNSDVFLGRIFHKDQFVEIVSLHNYLKIEPFENQQIVVFKDSNQKLVGIVIDAIGPICEIPQDMISEPKGLFSSKENFIEYIAKPPQGIKKILSIINPNKMIETLISLNKNNI